VKPLDHIFQPDTLEIVLNFHKSTKDRSTEANPFLDTSQAGISHLRPTEEIRSS